MGDNLRRYRPEPHLQNGRPADKYTNALSLALSQDPTGSGDLARLSQRDPWEHMNMFRQNLSSADLSKYTQRVHEIVPRVPAGWDRERRDGSSHSAANPLDMSISRSQNFFPPAPHQAEHHASSTPRNQRGAFSSTQAASYLPRSASYSSPSSAAPQRPNKRPDVVTLLETVKKGDRAEILRLIQSGVDINASEGGFTALHQAAKVGDKEMIKCLLSKGANPTMRDRFNQTPDEYLLRHDISIEALLREIHYASQKTAKPLHTTAYGRQQPYSKDVSVGLPAHFTEPRRSSRPPDHRLSSEQRPPDHRLSSEQRPPDHRLLSEQRPPDHRLSSEQRPPDHRLSSEQRPPDHRLSSEQRPPDHRPLSEQRPPDHRLSSEQRPPDHRFPTDHRQPDHQLSSESRIPADSRLQDRRHTSDHHAFDHQLPGDRRPVPEQRIPEQCVRDHRFSDIPLPTTDLRTPEHRFTDYRQSRPVEKPRYPRGSPAQLEKPAPVPEKRDEHRNHIEQTQKVSPYDRFPSPFDHICRPPQTGSLPPGLEIPHPPEPQLPISNGPKSYRVPESVQTSKYVPEHSSAKTDQRNPPPFVQKPPGVEKLIPFSELTKPGYSKNEMTKPSTPALSQLSSQDKSSRLSHINQHSSAERPDSNPLLLGVNSTRLSSPFSPELFGNLTSQEANARLSVPSNLQLASSLLYFTGSDPYPLSSVLYQQHLNPLGGLTIPTPATKVTMSQQPPSHHQAVKAASSSFNNRDRGSVPTNTQHQARKSLEAKHHGLERRYPFQRRQENHPSDHNRSRDSIHPDVRLPRPEPSLRHLDHPAVTVSSNLAPHTIQSAQTTSTTTLPVTTYSHLSHGTPTSTVTSPAPHPYSMEALEQASLQDVDMRKPVRQESKDTDMRPFLQHPKTAFTGRDPNKSAQKIDKRRDSGDHKHKSRSNSTSSTKSKHERRLSSSKSIGGRDSIDPKWSQGKTTPHSAKNTPKSYSKPSHESKKEKKSKMESTPKRKYTKVTAPIAKVAHGTLPEESKAKKSEEVKKSEMKPKGRKGRKRKHSTHSPGQDERSKSATTTIEASATTKVSSATTSITLGATSTTTTATAAATSTTTATESKDLSRATSVEEGVVKREKRRKKSEPEDEYVYDWMYDDFSSEPENDDSEDEDFRCPIPKPVTPGRRGRKRGIRQRPARQSYRPNKAMFFGGDSSPDEQLTDEEEPPRRSRAFKSTRGRRGRKPIPRELHVSPRKHKSRKLSSESAESEKSPSEQEPADKSTKIKVGSKSTSSDRDEDKEKRDPEKAVIKRGRGHRKPKEAKDDSKKQDTESNKESKVESHGTTPVKSRRGRKSAVKDFVPVVDENTAVHDKPAIKEKKKRGKKPKSKPSEETQRTETDENIRETNLNDNGLRETKLASNTNQRIPSIDLTDDAKDEIVVISDASSREKKAKRDSKTASFVKRGRKPHIDSKREAKLSDTKQESSSIAEKKKEIPAKQELHTKLERKSSAPEKKKKSMESVDTKPEVKSLVSKKKDSVLEAKLENKSNVAPKPQLPVNVASIIAKQDNQTASDAKRERKFVKQKSSSSLETKLESFFSADTKPESNSSAETKREIAEAKKESKTHKDFKRERKMKKQKSATEDNHKKPLKEKSSLEFSEKEKGEKEYSRAAKDSSEIKRLPSNTDSSHSLIELYTGKHVAPISAAVETDLSTVPTKPVEDKNLFWDDLTETEAMVLAGRGLLSNDATKSKTTTRPIELPPADVNMRLPPVEKNQPLGAKSNLLKEPPVKIPKKRGRKPNSLLHSKNSDLSAPSQKRLKLTANINKPKPHPPFALNNKVNKLGTTLTPDGLPKPRKGRPPGSLNKKKLNKGPPVAKVLKKPGRKPMLKTGRIPNINKKAPTVNISTSDRADPPFKNRLQPRTPLQFRPASRDRGVDSPCSSVSSTPLMPKHLRIISRGSTPVRDRRTPNPSPLPPNVKKLTSNNAIGETVLHKAVKYGYNDNISYYLEHGFEVNTKDNAGYTALHEACVKGRLEAAKLLLEFGADANINSEDGTRPIHDAVEYDRVEMTRLLLSCGADPMLGKFSGRSVRDMIHGLAMKAFLFTYLSELKPTDEEKYPDLQKWNISASSVLDPKGITGCDVLADPPDEDSICDEMEFELLEEEPIDSYLLHPSENASRGNYYCVSELSRAKKCTRGEFLLQHPADIKIIEAKKLKDDVERNWVKKKVELDADASDEFMELIAAENYRRNCRVFKVDSCGVVTPLLSPCTRSKSTYFHHGAFCEQRTYAFVDPAISGPSLSLENVDNPFSEASASQRSCESPVFSDSETALSGVTALAPPTDQAIDSHEITKCSLPPKNDLVDILGQNGIVQIPVPQNGLTCQDSIPNSEQALNLDPPKPEIPDPYAYQPMDIIPAYSPTSDLRPPVAGDNDPTRILTETENAVLNLAYDSGLPSIQLHRANYFNDVANVRNSTPNHASDYE